MSIRLFRSRYSKNLHFQPIDTYLSNLFSPTTGRKISSTTITSYPTGLDSIRLVEESKDEVNKCPFPIIKELNLVTKDRQHLITLTPNNVIKYIKLGAINRNLSIQYCHYLANLGRDSENHDQEYYAVRAANVAEFILKHNKDLPPLGKIELLIDLADSSSSNCSNVCTKMIDEQGLWPNIISCQLTKLVRSCYKFKLWTLASDLLDRDGPWSINWSCFDTLIESLNGAITHSESSGDIASLKEELLNHIAKLCVHSRKHRVQFFTKQPEIFVSCLERVMSEVVKRPLFKMTGRCTSCNTNIPLFDNKLLPNINRSIREVLDRKHMGELHLYSSDEDISHFYQFLENIHKIDKKPIDCVIDGLNIAYRNSVGFQYHKLKQANNLERTVKRHDPKAQVQVLVNTIIRSNFLERFNKILVIGKAHMERWPGLMSFFSKNNIHFYPSDNQAKDDLFQIYASTLSPRTVLVTNDFLRDHLALLDEPNRTQLERWIDTHQVWIDNRTLTPIWPTPYEKLPHHDKDRGTFHIPIVDYNKMDIISQHEPPPHLSKKLTMWVCCSTMERSFSTNTALESNPIKSNSQSTDVTHTY